MKQIRRRLTYANVMSSLAVFLVLGGGAAFAASKVGSDEIKANAITTGKIKKEAIARGKIKANAINSGKLADGSVTTAKLADKAVTGAKIDTATLPAVPSATSAQSAAVSEGPLAWAHVSGSGVLLAGRGITAADISIGSPNYYCIKGLSFSPAGATVSTDYWNGTNSFSTITQVGLASTGGLGGTGCPAGTQAFVKGWNANTAAASNAAFWVTFFK